MGNEAAQIATLRNQALRARSEALSGDLIIDVGPKGASAVMATAKLDKGLQWTEDTIRAISLGLVDTIVRQELAKGNEVDRILYDDNLFKDPSTQIKSITAIFQTGENVREVMKMVEASVAKRVPFTLFRWKAYGGVSNDTDVTELSRQLMSGGPVTMNYGDSLYYVPYRNTSSNADAVYRNIMYLRGLVPDASGRLKKIGAKRPKGYYAMAMTDVRRAAKSRGVHVKAIMTNNAGNIGQERTYPDYATGPGSYPSRRSPYTGKPVYVQGTWGFKITLLRGRGNFGSR